MALTAGSIAFTGYNGDGNDNLSFVALADIAQGTVINFTDSNWNGSSFAAGSGSESTITWTATSAISAGTVIDINNVGSGTLGASAGTVTFTNANNTGLSNDSEVVYAYIGTAAAPTFLAAISNVGYSTSDGTLTGTGLAAGQTAVSFTGGLDIMGYNGARSGQSSFAAYLAAINNSANWLTQNGSGNQSTDGTAPNAPFPTTAFSVTVPATQTISFLSSSVSIAEGDSGTRILIFTVVRSGGTTGAVTFSGAFAAGTTDWTDYGSALPTQIFSGTIADGATSTTVAVTISGDTAGESDESFSLTLTNLTNFSAPVTLGTATATGTIINDDGTLLSSDSSTPITLANNDHFSIASGVTLSGSTPVTWVGGSTSPGALLDNFGTVSGTNRAIYTSGSANGSFTVHNAAGATITAVKDAIKISNLGSGASGVFTLNNEGTISSTGTGGNAGQALDLDDVASAGVVTVINNSATGMIQAADADAIRPGTNATINNYGQIISHNGSASSTGNDAIDFQSVNSGGVVNNFAGGVIDGARHGITGDQPITVDNAGTISGEAGSGINLDTAGATTTVVNNAASGTITGHAVDGADADAIDVDGLVWIDNFGTIEAVGLTTGANGLNEALAIGGGLVHNEVGGLITSDQRAITVDDSNNGSAFAAITIINDGAIYGPNEAISITGTFADTITNTGVIEGNVAMGDGNDTLTSSGTIIGDALMGAGDDGIYLVTGSTFGTLDGGDGTDTIYLSGSGSGWIRTAVNVEQLVVQSGTWLDGDGDANYDRITVEGGATLVVWGVAGPTTVTQGATEIVYSMAIDSTVFGQQFIKEGAVASGTRIELGGEQYVYWVGVATGTTVDGGNQFVYGTADRTTIGAHGLQYLYGGATNTIIDSGGAQNIYANGTVSGTTLNAGGVQIDWGNAVDTTINGGNQYVWGTATGTTILSGVQSVGSGGIASGATINGGGEQIIHDGGTASAAMIECGDQIVYGSADQTTIGDGGLQSVYGSATNTAVDNGGEQNVYVNGTATRTTLNEGGVQIDWGTAVDTTINGGNQYVWGTATGTTILSGVQHVGAGGTASDTTIDSGGIAYVHTGGAAHDVTFDGPNATLALDQAAAFSGTISGWEDGDRIDLGDILFSEGGTTLAYAANQDDTGGTLTVSDGSHVASLELLGQYTAADFALSSDGHGGTLISDPGVVAQAIIAVPLHA
jgi:autotransporter passenger strand-loop-strand repeat protein